ncbi:MAG: hypothetical protein D6766_13925 [Verrucomicrobia bacterium]|nr:MAG: hypothetical protein D6766_13925 [Verrucomicrobiota bacterium]
MLLFALLVLTAGPPLDLRYPLGLDHGWELQKARMVNRGWTLYRDIWNDQPPLHTWVLSLLFRLGGEKAAWGCLLSLAAALAVGWCVACCCVRGIAGPVGVSVALLLMFASDPFLPLAISSQLIVPAAAAGMTAVCLAGWRRVPVRWAPLLAGAAMGIAAQVKMTALLYGPACAVILALRNPDEYAQEGWWGRLLRMAAFALVVVISFLAVALCWPGELQGLWTHFSPEMRAAFAHDLHFQWAWFGSNPALWALAASFPVAANRRQWVRGFPFLVNIIMTLAILQVHRPAKGYYMVHMVVPATILAAVSVQAGWDALARWWGRGEMPPLTLGWLAGIGALFYGLLAAPAELIHGLRRLHVRDLPHEREVLHRMQYCKRWSDWAFSLGAMPAFQAGMLTPPWTTVLPGKRIRLNPNVGDEVAADITRWRPGAVYIPSSLVTESVRSILDQQYQLVFQADQFLLYFRRDIATHYHEENPFASERERDPRDNGSPFVNPPMGPG